MIELPIKYTNLDGKEVVETWSFHMDLDDAKRLGLLSDINGLQNRLREYAEKNDIAGVLDMLDDLIVGSVGHRSANGRLFEKTEETRKDFRGCGAFTALLVQLMSGEIKSDDFFRGVLPKDLLNAGDAKPAQAIGAPSTATVDISKLSVEDFHRLSDEDWEKLYNKHKNNLPRNAIIADYERKNKRIV